MEINIPPNPGCPFEAEGRRNNTIHTVAIKTGPEYAGDVIRDALDTLYNDKKIIGLELVLPESVLVGCTDIHGLARAILPYQCVVVAAEVDYRLRPFLKYQVTPELVRSISEEQMPYACMALGFIDLMGRTGGVCNSMNHIARWLFDKVGRPSLENKQSLTLMVSAPRFDTPPLSISSYALSILFEQRPEWVSDPSRNENLFSLVRCPFYPTTFPRFSERVIITLTREAHFATIRTERRDEIRRKANTPLLQAGVAMNDVRSFKLPPGLWIPN